MQKLILAGLFLFQISLGFSQNTDTIGYLDFLHPKEYIIADIKVTGVKYLNPTHLISISGLDKGQKISIPGVEIAKAVKKYWKYGLFSNVQIIARKIEGSNIYLEIQLKEQPRVNNLEISGIKKGEQDDIKEKIELKKGTQLTDDIINNTKIIIRNHYIEKGFFNTDVNIKQKQDTSRANHVNVKIYVDKNKKVKIEEIIFEGNEAVKTKKLRKVFKKTKQRDLNIFKGSKYLESDYKEDKIKLIDYYNKLGYRDARIENEELYEINPKRIGLKLKIFEGEQYYIRNISWIGNTKYPSEYLSRILGIKEKQLYNKKQLEARLNTDEDAVSTLYMDNGHLFFSVTPIEVRVEDDSVDLELRIYEGDPATINKIVIRGNTKTNEHVVRRELYTRPGELFSKSDLMRSYREIATLGHFNPENIGINPLPNQADGTVDIEYSLEERANDQLELSGGWGGYYGFVGSVGVRFTNLALGRVLDKEAWRPVPTGDGQTFSIRAQSNVRYHSLSLSFVEPWFGGKKPNSFSVSTNYTLMKRGSYEGNRFKKSGTFRTIGASVGFGKRLKWPDDYFSIYTEMSFSEYKLDNYQIFQLTDGFYNLFSVKGVFSRSSQDQMIYPRKGSAFSLSAQFTPPYSVINGKDYGDVAVADRYKNVEFHKWLFNAAWYTELFKDFVLAIKGEFGALGFYNKDIGYPIFEKFDMGGSGLSGYSQIGTDVIPLRGYEDGALTPKRIINGNQFVDDGNIYSRYYAEFRYPITLNPSATLYGLAFIEGGNIWSEWDKFNPFAIKRSAGFGVRAFLPMFGLLGFDWGYGFDDVTNQYGNPIPDQKRGQFHFIMGQQF